MGACPNLVVRRVSGSFRTIVQAEARPRSEFHVSREVVRLCAGTRAATISNYSSGHAAGGSNVGEARNEID